MDDHSVGHKPLQQVLAEHGVELDQRLERAASVTTNGVTDDALIFYELYRQNSSLTRLIEINPHKLSTTRGYLRRDEREAPREDVLLHEIAVPIFERAIEQRKDGTTLGTKDFLRALLETGVEKGETFLARPLAVDILAESLEEDATGPLSKSPKAVRLLATLRERTFSEEDYQYVLAFEGERIVFRPSSMLDDYVQRNDSGLLLPQRGILTHFQESFGGFTLAEIGELEELLNSPRAREQDFQNFFERFPHFLRTSDYREVYPHVTLVRPEGALIPDFLLTDRELQRAAILELKLPSPRVVRRQHNRDRFSDALMSARAQLLLYREWFRDPRNRASLAGVVNMQIYEPRMIVVIGRAAEFRDEIDRQRLRADNPDIDVVTYDDILAQARRRQIIIAGG